MRLSVQDQRTILPSLRLPVIRTHQGRVLRNTISCYPTCKSALSSLANGAPPKNLGYAHLLNRQPHCHAYHRPHVQTSHKATVTLEHNATYVRDQK